MNNLGRYAFLTVPAREQASFAKKAGWIDVDRVTPRLAIPGTIQKIQIESKRLTLARGTVMTIKRLLLLSGPMRSGKSSVAQALKENHAFSGISSSGYLRSYAQQSGVNVERSQLQDLGDRLDVETDFAWVIDAVARPAVEAAATTENWLLDAVRKPRQVDHFRAQFPHLVKHVHLCAPEKILRTRYAAGRSAADPDYGVASAHPNEVAARSLGSIADETYDTAQASATDIAAQIVDNWEV